MKEATFKPTKSINPDRLHEEIKAALGDVYVSMGTDENGITVKVTESATPDDAATVEMLIAKHDPALLSSEQRRVKDRAEAYTHFVGFDFDGLRALKSAEQNSVIIDLLEDIQKLMRGVG